MTGIITKPIIWGVVAVGAILLILILFKDKIFGASVTPPSEPQCPSTFALHPEVAGISGVVTVTYTTQNGKYYSQSSGGALGYSGSLAPKEITQEAFLAACKTYQTQPTQAIS